MPSCGICSCLCQGQSASGWGPSVHDSQPYQGPAEREGGEGREVKGGEREEVEAGEREGEGRGREVEGGERESGGGKEREGGRGKKGGSQEPNVEG